MRPTVKRNGAAERCLDCPALGCCAFAELPAEALAEFQSFQHLRVYGRRSMILRQGDRAPGALIVRSGWVKLFRLTPDGRAMTLGLVGPGSLLGLREVLTGTACEAGAEALEESEIEVVGRERFLQFLEKQPRLAVTLLRTLSFEAGRLFIELSEVAAKLPTSVRMLRTLQGLAACCGRAEEEGTRIRLRLTVQDLADRIGCTRQWATKLLGDLEAEGMIRRRKGWITVTGKGLQEALAGAVQPSSPLSRTLP